MNLLSKPERLIIVVLLAISAVVISTDKPATAALPAGQLPTLAPMLEQVMPAVVNISTEKTVRVQRRPRFGDPFFRRFFDPRYQQPEQESEQRRSGIGSGVIIDAGEGHIITNYHVIEGADDVYVTLDDDRRFKAEVIGSDPDTDIAVIEIDADDLTDIPFGDMEITRVGDFVVAIGNPFHLNHTVTLGIISALGRSGLGIESYEDFIQTDASINPGNSGGALVNLDGKLIGINTAILGDRRNIGIGFAIPVSMVANVTEQLIEYGEVNRGRLGVVIQTLTPDLVEAFDLDRDRGVVITEVVTGSAADEAGLKAGDVVLAVDGKPIDDGADMRNHVGLLRVGSELVLDVSRNGRELTLTAVIVEHKVKEIEGAGLDRRLAGALMSLQKKDKSSNDMQIVIDNVALNSPAQRNGLRADDIILSVNRHPVSDFDEMKDIINRDKALLLRLQRDGKVIFYALRP